VQSVFLPFWRLLSVRWRTQRGVNFVDQVCAGVQCAIVQTEKMAAFKKIAGGREMSIQRDDSSTIELPMSSNVERQDWIKGYRATRHDIPALSLGARGLIQDCSKSLEILFGFARSDLVWQPVSKLFPELVEVELIQAGQVNPFINYLCRCGHLYQSQNRQGDTFFSNLSIVRLDNEGRRTFRMIVRPSVL
jgi:hypothetical protein